MSTRSPTLSRLALAPVCSCGRACRARAGARRSSGAGTRRALRPTTAFGLDRPWPSPSCWIEGEIEKDHPRVASTRRGSTRAPWGSAAALRPSRGGSFSRSGVLGAAYPRQQRLDEGWGHLFVAARGDERGKDELVQAVADVRVVRVCGGRPVVLVSPSSPDCALSLLNVVGGELWRRDRVAPPLRSTPIRRRHTASSHESPAYGHPAKLRTRRSVARA
jgi:hypothetical protein